MGRLLLCGKEAENPYEVEELDLRLYTIEELCYYVFHNVPLLRDDFIDERLIGFIRRELQLPDIADKIARFYHSPSDADNTLYMLLSEVGYYSESELQEFQETLAKKRKKNGPERVKDRADSLASQKRYQAAVRVYRTLSDEDRDARVTDEMKCEALEKMADCYGRLCAYREALNCLERAYNETGDERLLKKMYHVCMLSGLELDPFYFRDVPDAAVSRWQQEYRSKEAALKATIDRDPAMEMFFGDPVTLKKELEEYADSRKEVCRRMLE